MKAFLRLATLLTGLAIASMAYGGEWHTEPNLLCQNCHVQHASQDGQPIPGGPFSTLLLKNTVNELCLSCHDGTDPTAPDVASPVQMYESTPSGESAAGYFEMIGIDNLAGHNLAFAAVTPHQTEALFVELNCVSCHAQHGNGNYRNLRYDPMLVGDSIVLVDGADLFTQFSPDIPPTITGTIAAYNRDNTRYRQNYSDWCASCHNQLAANNISSPPAHFNSHPVDVAINEFTGDPHTDPVHWVNGLGEGFPDDAAGIDRVPFESPLSADFTGAGQPAETDQVFCGSCHKAHGRQYAKSLLWSYKEGDVDFIAGCQQCHNK